MSAISFLNSYFGHYEAMSELVETEAVGFEGPAFLNCVVRYNTRRRPATILEICKRIEKHLGREDSPEYAPDGSRIYHSRIIDIDILLYGNVRMDTPELTIPHPQVENRAFVKPLLGQVVENN